VPRKNAACISIGNKVRQLAGIKQNRVCRFRTQAAEGQQLRTCIFRGLRKQSVERALMGGMKPFGEIPDSPRLLAEIAGRLDTFFNLGSGSLLQSRPMEETGIPKARNSPGGVLPVRVLGEDSAEDDLQASACRPPTLGAELPK